MTIKARRNVQLRGHIYARGETAEWDGPVDARIAWNFTAADGRPLAVGEGDAGDSAGQSPAVGTDGGKADAGKDAADEEKVKRTVAALKREGIIRQLDDMGVTFRSSAKTDYLARLLLMSKGEITEA